VVSNPNHPLSFSSPLLLLLPEYPLAPTVVPPLCVPMLSPLFQTYLSEEQMHPQNTLLISMTSRPLDKAISYAVHSENAWAAAEGRNADLNAAAYRSLPDPWRVSSSKMASRSLFTLDMACNSGHPFRVQGHFADWPQK